MTARRRSEPARAASVAVLVVVLALAAGVRRPAGAAPAADTDTSPEVAVELAPGPHTVGDRVEAVLSITVAAGELSAEPRFPAWSGAGGSDRGAAAVDASVPTAAWGEAEVVAAGPVEREEAAGAVSYRQRLVLAAFAPGRLPLPPLAVALPLADRTVEARTPADLALTIDSVLPTPATGEGERAGAELTPRPPAPPRPLPLGAAFWWTAALLAAACAGAIVLNLLQARRRAVAADAAPPIPPFAELTAAIEAARRAGSPLAGHTLLSRALRRYLGRSLGFPAPESTTSEIHRALADRALPSGTLVRAVEVLRACDLVKFARRPADVGALAARAGAVLALAADLEDFLRPALPAVETGGDRLAEEAA